MRADALTVLVLVLLGGFAPARAASTNPDILLNQVGGSRATARGAVGIQNVAPANPSPNRLGSLAVAPVPAGPASGSRTGVIQPLAALDRCEAILENRAPPIQGLDCSAGQLNQLRREAEAASVTAEDLGTVSLSRDLRSIGAAPGQVDPITGVPIIVLLTPGR